MNLSNLERNTPPAVSSSPGNSTFFFQFFIFFLNGLLFQKFLEQFQKFLEHLSIELTCFLNNLLFKTKKFVYLKKGYKFWKILSNIQPYISLQQQAKNRFSEVAFFAIK